MDLHHAGESFNFLSLNGKPMMISSSGKTLKRTIRELWRLSHNNSEVGHDLLVKTYILFRSFPEGLFFDLN